MSQIIKKDSTCDTTCFNEELVKDLKDRVEEVNGVAELFKALADPTRMKIAYALTIEKELCVCDVANIIGSTTATASHHLRLLRDKGLAKFRKDGKMVYYSLDDDHIHQLVSIALIHSKEGVSHGEGNRK
ncbi:ArsR/SmtB family transcription factor [Mangrovibacillus cuniculi]|uniref:Winged helix-turn-helix transcriptional regulator n=1 Tax=Mangrovibacillus cuniculi TaxID=2593652 RepID=A0A7S8C925_9BACI|nr:metalloregulator ArsR/SmtB family transcription factor [Mangrovibacillus cuniculi]QPC45662.1 winged helix-turn-helix transcriptional regulator [Mangrovibacillus cuniculi]